MRVLTIDHRDGRVGYHDKRWGADWRSGRSLSGDTYLLGKDLRLEVFQWQLEASITVIVEHLDSDQVFRTWMSWESRSRHDARWGGCEKYGRTRRDKKY